MLSSLSGYRCIITDTYHVCVNAWRMGIPAICIGEGGGKVSTSINDKKKEILYDMYGARRFYLFLESFRSLKSLKSVRSFMEEAKRAATCFKTRALFPRYATILPRISKWPKKG